MKEVQDRVVQFSNRYKLTNVETGEVLGTFDFDEITGTVQQVGTEIDAELFDSIAADLAARVVSNGGELKDTVVTFTDLTGTASNVASGDKTSTLWSKVKNWFSRLKALAFKDKISNADVANDANIVQSKIDGLRTEQNGVQIGTAAVCSGAGAAVGSSSRATSGGGAVGYNARATSGGGAVGVNASAQNGGAVGSGASATNGGAVGSGASATSGGGAVGNNASATSGGAVGNNASATSGGAVGSGASATSGGGAVGNNASATSGGAVGSGASATDGFAGGKSAIAEASGAVQLGAGRNKTANTLQFRDYQIVDANGNIPAERLGNSPVASVNNKTGKVSLTASDVGAAALSATQYWSAEQHFNAGFTALNGGFSFSDTTNIGMELGRRDGTPGTPYIDFHTDGSSSTDYNSRILATGKSLQITAEGGVSINGNNINAISMAPANYSSRIEVSVTSAPVTYTAPANGYFVVYAHNNGSIGYVNLQNRGTGINFTGSVPGSSSYYNIYVPARAGNAIWCSFTSVVDKIFFIPAYEI